MADAVEFTCRVFTPPPGDDDGGSPAPVDVQFSTLSVLKDAYWEPEVRVLPVSFLDVSDRGTIDMIVSHMNSWECGVSFAWSASGGLVRVTTGAGGYWSYLGKGILQVPAGQPTMNLEGIGLRTPESERRRVIRHETGHTLGFPHEHLRPEIVADIDPARAYAYYWEWQRWGRAIVDTNVLRPLSQASIMGTPVDGTSLMAYPIPAAITYSGRAVPGGADINETDRRYARSIYPLPAPPPTPPPPVEPPRPEPPPVKPPEPVKPDDAGPYDLRIGVPSDRFTMLAGASLLFRFRARANRVFVATTQGKIDLTIDLLDAEKKVLRHDDDSGLKGNPLVHAPLKPGTYYLRIKGSHKEVMGSFRVKVEALS